jgi:hypothetical protein
MEGDALMGSALIGWMLVAAICDTDACHAEYSRLFRTQAECTAHAPMYDGWHRDTDYCLQVNEDTDGDEVDYE